MRLQSQSGTRLSARVLLALIALTLGVAAAISAPGIRAPKSPLSHTQAAPATVQRTVVAQAAAAPARYARIPASRTSTPPAAHPARTGVARAMAAGAPAPPTAVPFYTFPGKTGGDTPKRRLVLGSDGNLYGVTQFGGNGQAPGTVYRVTPDGTVTTLATFGKNAGDGAFPSGDLVEGLNGDGTPNGSFYGTTGQGGTFNKGTVYQLAADAGSPTGYSIFSLYSFTGGADGLDPASALTPGRNADGTFDGYLYGTTYSGGIKDATHPAGNGVVYRITPGGAEATLHAFPVSNSSNVNTGGAHPESPLVQRHDASGWHEFLGDTLNGGSHGLGTVFAMDASGAFVSLHDFGANGDGVGPFGGLTQAADGSLFGMTNTGGDQGEGTVYQLVPSANSPSGYVYALYVSLTTDEGNPLQSLIQASDGKLYGTASNGGSPPYGSVFRLDADANSPTGHSATPVFLVSDPATEGSSLQAGLTQGADGDLYGAAANGGSAGVGTLYRLNAGLPPPGRGPAPQISSLDYHVNSDGTATVAVTGANFVDRPGANVTNVYTGTSLTVTFVSATHLTLTLDRALPAGDHTVTITNPDGQTATATLTTLAPPQITSAEYHVNGDGTSYVLVNGTGFQPALTFSITNVNSGTAVTTVTVVSATQVRADLNSLLPAGEHTITITNPDGQQATTVLTTYNAPQITSATYTDNGDGTSFVTLNGANFVATPGANVTNVYTGTTLSVVFFSATQVYLNLSKTLPVGDHLIVLTNPDGQSASFVLTIAPAPAPTISHLQSIARSDGSSDLVITGTGFIHTPNVHVTLLYTGTTLALAADSPTSITVHLSRTLPPGDHDVTVTNPDGQSVSARLTTYGTPRVDGAAAIAQSDGTVLMVVSGVNFYPGGYNGDFSGATVIVRTPGGTVVPSSILGGPGVPANIGDPQQITLSLGRARSGQNYSVEVDNNDGQTSTGTVLSPGARSALVRPQAVSAGSARFNVYTKDRTQYNASFFETILKFFHLQFLLQPSSGASPTQLLPGNVSLLQQYACGLTPTGPGSIAMGLVASGAGNLVASGAGNLIGNDGSGIVSHDGGSIVSHDGGSIVSHDGGSLVASGAGNLIGNDGSGLVASGAGNAIPVDAIIGPVGAAAGLAGKLDVATLVASGAGNLVASGAGNIVHFHAVRRGGLQASMAAPEASASKIAVSFSLTHFDQGPENGTGSTDGVVIGQDANGNDIEILRIRYTPGQPDVVIYAAPGLTLAATSGTPAPLVANVTPTLTAINPTAATAGAGPVTLAVAGSFFEDGAVVSFNGQPLATTVLSGTQATALAPAGLLMAAGTASVTIANPAPGGGASNALPFTINAAPPPPPPPAPVLHTYPAGLQMFSAPEDFSGIPNTTAFGGPVKIAAWDPALVQYALSPAPPADALHLGHGYWARFKAPTPLYDLGKPATAGVPFAVPLARGWNMIGDPFPVAVPLDSVTVKDDAGQVYTLSAANRVGLVSRTLYGFAPGSRDYQTLTAPDGALAPYAGYWVYALHDCTLVVSPVPLAR